MNYGIANKNGQINKNEARSILDYAYSFGINTLDTAKAYGCSESVIGSYLKERKSENWCIITKIKSLANNSELIGIDSVKNMAFAPTIVLAHSAADYLKPSFCNALHL